MIIVDADQLGSSRNVVERIRNKEEEGEKENMMTAESKTDVNKLLFKAVKSGNLEDVEEAISQGANVNAKDRARWTPLHFASARGHAEVAEFLIKKGAKINATDLSNWTPLWVASNNQHQELVSLLKTHGAEKY